MPTERMIEAKYCELIRDMGGEAYKFSSPARRGVPDRLILHNVRPEDQSVVARYVRFVEFKAPGEKPTAMQRREHKRLRDMGFVVEVVDK
jgi:hypothetical protein